MKASFAQLHGQLLLPATQPAAVGPVAVCFGSRRSRCSASIPAARSSTSSITGCFRACTIIFASRNTQNSYTPLTPRKTPSPPASPPLTLSSTLGRSRTLEPNPHLHRIRGEQRKHALLLGFMSGPRRTIRRPRPAVEQAVGGSRCRLRCIFSQTGWKHEVIVECGSDFLNIATRYGPVLSL